MAKEGDAACQAALPDVTAVDARVGGGRRGEVAAGEVSGCRMQETALIKSCLPEMSRDKDHVRLSQLYNKMPQTQAGETRQR